MARSIVGLFPHRTSAEAAIRDLTAAGFNPDRIGLVMRDPGEARDVADDRSVNTAAGAVVGGAVGGTAGWLIGGLAGMGVPRDEAEYYQGRVEQGSVLVTVDPRGRDDEARRILLRNGAEGERTEGAGARPAAGATPYPTGTTDPYAADRANLGATGQGTSPVEGSSYAATTREDTRSAGQVGPQAAVPSRAPDRPPLDQGELPAYGPTLAADPQQFPPADSGIAPGTMAEERSPDQGAARAARPETSVGSELGGVQPSAVSDQPSGAARGDLLHQEPPTAERATPDVPSEPTQSGSPYSGTVTSAGAQEGADYNRGARRAPPDRPITDADIIAEAEGKRRQTNPDLDVQPDADQSASEQRGLY